MALSAREERRRRRSDDTLTALTLWLEGARRRGELDCLALCDETGCLIAGAGVHRQCEELAALGAVRAADPGTDADVRVAPVDLRGVRALICADAGARRESAHMLSAIAAGCRRILLQPRFATA
ncbi:MAG TPA: hypothetical protein VF989_13040 [Polyangiaceae bacterium]